MTNDEKADAIAEAQKIAKAIETCEAELSALRQRYPAIGRELSVAITQVETGRLWLGASIANLHGRMDVS